MMFFAIISEEKQKYRKMFQTKFVDLKNLHILYNK